MRWLAIFTVLLFATLSRADTVLLPAAVDGSGQDHFDGAFNFIPPSNDVDLHVFTGLDLEQRAALEFDLSAIPASAEIQDAQLLLRMDATDDADTNLSIFGYEGDGLLETSDFSSGMLVNQTLLPGSLGLPLSLLPFDVTDFLTQHGNDHYAGFELRLSPLGTRNFASNMSVESWRPELEIDYIVPEPPAVVIATLLVAMCYLCSRLRLHQSSAPLWTTI